MRKVNIFSQKLFIEDKLILLLARLNFTKDEIKHLEESISGVNNWEYLTQSAIRNGVGALLYKNILSLNFSDKIPPETILKLKNVYYLLISKNVILYEHFKEAVIAISKQGISVIALKGIFIAEKVYKDIGLRLLSDIDLLIQTEEIEKAANSLINSGFVDYNKILHKNFHLKKDFAFVKNDVLLELHQHIHQCSQDINVNISDYWKRSKKTTVNGLDVFVLSDEDMIQHLCLHLFVHLRKGNFSLISFVDIAELLTNYYSNFNWNLFNEINIKYNCSKEAYTIIYLTNKYLNLELPEKILEISYKNTDPNLENRFIDVLHGNEIHTVKSEVNKLIYFNKTKGFTNKLKYFISELFPIKNFMINRYKPKYKSLYFLYYPLRFVVILIKFFKNIISR